MASIWRRLGVFLGLIDDDECEEFDPDGKPSASGRRAGAKSMAVGSEAGGGVRTLTREAEGAEGSVSVTSASVLRPVNTPVRSAKVHVVAPVEFNDAKEIGDTIRSSQPIIINLQGVERDLKRRIIDFSSGLAYGLEGRMEKVADWVFLIEPNNVKVSAEEKRRLQERGLYSPEP